MYFVYILKLNHPVKRLYIGSTPDIKRRMRQHMSGQVEFTKSKLPVELFYIEGYNNRNLALIREKNLKKSGSTYVGLLKRLGLK